MNQTIQTPTSEVAPTRAGTRRVPQWLWPLLLYIVGVGTIRWIQHYRSSPWFGQIEVQVADAHGAPIEGVTFGLTVIDDLGGGKKAMSSVYAPVRFEEGRYLLGLPRDKADVGTDAAPSLRTAQLIVRAPQHGCVQGPVEGPTTRVTFPDPAWVTFSFDPLLDPADLERRFIWPHDYEHGGQYDHLQLDDGTFSDGTYRAGPFVPGGYSFALRRRSPPSSDRKHSGMSMRLGDTPDIILISGENEYTIQPR